MRKIMSKQLTAFLVTTLALLVLGSVALQAQDSTKVMTPAQPQPLSLEEFKKVSQSTNPQDWMKIQAMTDDQVKAIMNSKVLVLRLGAVVEEWQALSLNGLTYITDEQAKLLAKNEVNLSLDGLKSLTDEQAKSFSTYKGKFMPRAYQNDPAYQRMFGMRAGGILSLNGIATLSDEQVKWFGKAKCFELDLNSLTSISDLQAKSFGYFAGAILQLNALKTMTDKQAKGLAQFQGKIALLGLDKPSKDLFLKYGGSLIGKE
jgi:hypothetical protein